MIRGLLYIVRVAAMSSALCLVVAVITQKDCRAQSLAQMERVVEGKVVGTANQPESGAIVYLQNQKSLEVKTYITEADGTYRFGQLSPDADYQLWARYKGHRSKTKAISSFDSKREFNFQLKIDTSK